MSSQVGDSVEVLVAYAVAYFCAADLSGIHGGPLCTRCARNLDHPQPVTLTA